MCLKLLLIICFTKLIVIFLLYRGGKDGVTYMWTITTTLTPESPLQVVYVTSLCVAGQTSVTGLDMYSKHALLAVGYSDGSLKVWDIQVNKMGMSCLFIY